MNEKIFREKYRSAYDHVLPDEDSIEKIMARATEENQRQQRWGRKVLRPVLTTFLFMCILSAVSLPVLAVYVPAVYHILEKYVPDMADYLVRREQHGADKGVSLGVEGREVEGEGAERGVACGRQEG